ncbi:BLUF domain-containing protein [Mameliella alba]|nr:BLUF domain-containing protein [Antarctobacter heliothermus]MBY6146981.1 BLUF domain-containing protein [Mameliella alba]MCA0956901.1 BLUF domain-containing protein [Mameliella alba]
MPKLIRFGRQGPKARALSNWFDSPLRQGAGLNASGSIARCPAKARSGTGPLAQTFFVSTATFARDSSGTQELLAATRRKNPLHGITGVLFRTDQHFVQLAEGREKDLATLMSAIHCDTRHWDVQEWPCNRITKRRFSGWLSETRDNVEVENLVSLARGKRGIMPVDTLLAHLRKLTDPAS